MGLLPTLRARRLYDVSVEALKEMGISLVLLDMDNTLAPWHSTEVSEESREWIRKVQGESITVALFTNSAGGNADIIGKSVNIPVYKNAKKPFKAASLRLMKELGVAPENVLFIGDQLFTDIQLANAIGAKSVLCEPLEDREWWCTKVFNRTRERIVWRFLFK